MLLTCLLKKSLVGNRMKPLVSICLSTYKRPKWLKESLESILVQQGVDVQLILMDNGSNCSETDSVIEQLLPKFYKYSYIKFLSNDFKHFGRMEALIDGNYVTQFTDDDRMLPGNLYTKVSALQSSGAGICFSPAWHIDQDGKRCGSSGGFRRGDIIHPKFNDLFATSRLIMPSVMMTRDAWEIPHWGHVIGHEWGRYLSIVEAGQRVRQITHPLVELRLHAGTDTNVRGLGDGMFLDMHLQTWKYWMEKNYTPPQQVKDDMYRIYFDLAWKKYGEGPMLVEACKDFCNLW